MYRPVCIFKCKKVYRNTRKLDINVYNASASKSIQVYEFYYVVTSYI